MKKLILILSLLAPILVNAQYRKDQLSSKNNRDIKAYGNVSSKRLGDMLDSLILSLESQKRAAGYIPVGNASGIATDVPLSGDGSLSSSGALTVSRVANISWPNSGTGFLSYNGSSYAWATPPGSSTSGAFPLRGNGSGGFTNLVWPTSGQLIMSTGIDYDNSGISSDGTTATFGAVPNFPSQTANKFFASPNGSSGVPSMRTIVAADLPSTAVTPGSYTNTNLTVDAQGRITAASNGSGGSKVLFTAVKTSNYTASAFDGVPCDDTSGSFTVTLPTAPADGTLVYVKRISTTGMNTVTIACGGSDVFNKAGGSTSGTLSLPNQGFNLLYKSSGAIWYVTADDLPLSQLDARFKNLTYNVQTSNYTLTLIDQLLLTEVVMNVVTSNNLTIPTDASVAFPLGTVIYLKPIGAGVTTVVASGGVSITSTRGTLALPAGFLSMIEKTASNTWTLHNGSPDLVSSDITTALGYTPIAASGTTVISSPTFTQNTASSGSTPILTINGANLTGQTASELIDFSINPATRTFTGNTGFALNRTYLFQPGTYAFTSATGTIVDAYTMTIATAAGGSGVPIVGSNAAITNKWAFGAFAGSGVFRVSSTLTKNVNIGGLGININNGGINLLANNNDPASSSTIQVGTVSNVTSITTAATNSTLTLNVTSLAQTSGTTIGNTNTINIGPASGTGVFKQLTVNGNVNMTGGSGNVTAFSIETNIAAATANFTDLDINTTNTSIAGTHYGILQRNAVPNSWGAGATPANALMVIGAGTTSLAPLKFTSGTDLTTPVAGVFGEYNGINFTATPSGTTRKVIMLSQVSRATAQTAANASVTTWTVGANDGSFEVGANVNLTASTTNSFTTTCTYTDETNTSRTVTFSFVQNGVAAPIQTITNVTGVGAYSAIPLQIRCKAATSITIATTGTFTSVTYNVEGRITQLN